MSGFEIKGHNNLAHAIEKQLGVNLPGIVDGAPFLASLENLSLTVDDNHIALKSNNGREIDIYSNGSISSPTPSVTDDLMDSVPATATSAEDTIAQTAINFAGRRVGNALFNDILLPDTSAHKAKKLIKALEYLAGDQTGKIPFGCKALVESLRTAMRQDSGAENSQFDFTSNGVGISFNF